MLVDACIEFCFLKKEFLNLTINMQLLLTLCYHWQTLSNSFLLAMAIAIPISPFFIFLLVNGFSVTCFRTFFADPLPSFNWWVVSVGGEELKWCQLAQHLLMSQQGPHFSPHNKAKANYKSTISGNW